MTTDEVLEVIREKIGQAVDEVNCNSPSYPDSFLLNYVKTANFSLTVLGISTGVTIASGAILPDPSIPIGMILAVKAAASVVKSDLINRVRNGELGLSFSSGASSISTIQAASTLRVVADGLFEEVRLLLTAYLSGDPNQVLGRDI